MAILSSNQHNEVKGVTTWASVLMAHYILWQGWTNCGKSMSLIAASLCLLSHVRGNRPFWRQGVKGLKSKVIGLSDLLGAWVRSDNHPPLSDIRTRLTLHPHQCWSSSEVVIARSYPHSLYSHIEGLKSKVIGLRIGEQVSSQAIARLPTTDTGTSPILSWVEKSWYV